MSWAAQYGASIMIRDEEGCLKISGDLNFQTVNHLWDASLPFLAKYRELHFDFHGVNSVNSAGLALLLEWIKYAKNHQKSLRFSHLPQKLRLIAEAAGLEKILP